MTRGIPAVEHSGERCRSIRQRREDHRAVGHAFRSRWTDCTGDRFCDRLDVNETHEASSEELWWIRKVQLATFISLRIVEMD